MHISFSHLSRISARVNWYFLLAIVGVGILGAATYTQLSFAAPGDSEEVPIEIDSCEDLQLMQSAALETYFKLTTDIDCTGVVDYEPIANFSGQLDGNNKTIRNLTISKPANDGVGLFATISGATIKNLRLESISVTGGHRVGALAGYADYVVDEEDEGMYYNSIITNIFLDSISVVSSFGNAYIGGLIGHVSGSTVSRINMVDAAIQSSASGSGAYLGGLFGVVAMDMSVSVYVYDVYLQGSVSKSTATGFAGGVIGYIDAWGNNSISRVVSDVDVAISGGTNYVGGFIGSVWGTSDMYTEIVVLGSVSSASEVGAVVGYAADYSENPEYFDTDYCPNNGFDEYLCEINGVSPSDLEDWWGWSCMYDEGDDSYSCEYYEPATPVFEPAVYSRIYYSTATGQSECVNSSYADAQGYDESAIVNTYTSNCTEVDVGINPGYFFDSGNLPFSDSGVWDFTNVWQENDGAPPTLRSSFTEGEEGGENTAPTITVGTPSQRSIMVGAPPYTVVSVTTTLTDADSDTTSLIMQYSLDGSTWSSSTLSSVTPSEGSVTTSSGMILGIDTDSDGSVGLTILWDAAVDIADGTYDTDVYLRFIPNDGDVDGDTVTSSAFTIDFADPTAPGEIDILSVTTSSITIARPNPTSTDPNLVGYAVYMNTTTDVFSGGTLEWGGGQDSNLLNGNWNGVPFTTIDSPVGRLSGGLTPNTRYYLQLFAFDMYANAATTTEISTITLAATPTNFVTTTVATSSISLSWNANSNPEGTVYTVSTTGYLATTTEASITVTGLEPSTTYTIELFASNDADVETNSISLEVTTEHLNYEPGLSVIERSTSTAEIAVLPASGVDVAYYELTNVTTDEVATSTEATFVLSGLTPNTEYEFVARTYSSGDVASATSSVSTLVTYAVPPESLTVTDVTHNSMTFDWSDSGATLYRLFDVDDLETPIISTAGLFLSLESFECETAYEFALYAYNQLDEASLTSSTAAVTTGACVDEDEDDDTPPSRGGGGATLLFLRQLNVSPALSSDISTFANAIRINRDRSVLRTRRLSVMVPAYIGADTLTLSLGSASRRSVTKKIPNSTRTTHFLMPSTARAGSYILYITFRTSDGREVTIEKPFTYRPLPIRVVDTAPVSVQTPATPAAIPTFTSFLSRGSQGAEVLALQQLLIRLGYFPSTITPNGVYGPTTEESVRVFQRANGIDARGYVGPGTREVLNRLR